VSDRPWSKDVADVQRIIDGPRGGEFLTTAQAARYVGLNAQQFEKLIALEDWIRPVYFGRRKKTWRWMDVVCFAHIYQAREAIRQAASPGPPPEEKK
jgi:hypothetical protein